MAVPDRPPASTGDPALDAALARLGARGPGRMVPDLSRITALMGLLGDPQLAHPTIHVTGTNGKGSVSRIAASLLDAAGLPCGLYTSPHLEDVRERMVVAGERIDAEAFVRVFDEVDAYAALVDAAAVERDGPSADRVTYFELLTAMAFAWFADVPVAAAVVEVGMGGRWDATNVVHGDVAVIGEVDVDHWQLGDTPAAIAAEKVGIIEPGAVVVSAAQSPEVTAVVDAAVREADAELLLVGRDLAVVDRQPVVGGQRLTVRLGDRTIDGLVLPLVGPHQARNALLALGAVAALLGRSFDAVDDDLVRAGLAAVRVPGRLEVVARDPLVLLDGAHNPHGARAAAVALPEATGGRPTVLVVACLDDKDVAGILGELRDVVARVVVTTAPSARAADLARMVATARDVWAGTGVVVEAADDVDQAVETAVTLAGEDGAVLVAGSLTTVGRARTLLRPDARLAALDPGSFRTLVTAIDHDDDADAADDDDTDPDAEA